MQRSLIGRLEALEQQAPGSDAVDTILISFVAPGDGGPVRRQPVAIKEMRGDWRLDREPGEPVDDFRERASRLCPRNGVGVAALVEVLA